MDHACIYEEPYYSKCLVELNKRNIDLYNFIAVTKERKKELLRNLIAQRNIQQAVRQLKLKLHRSEYINVSGNRTFASKIIENLRTIEQEAKIAAYTCIVGACDTIKEPMFFNPQIDYFVFTDQDLPLNSRLKKIDITKFEEYSKYSPVTMNRRIKILSHEYLKDYDYTLYLDSTVRIIGDIYPIICNIGNAYIGVHSHASRDCAYMEAEAVNYLKKSDPKQVEIQMRRYKEEGFPKHYGLFQNSIVIRNQKIPEVRTLMQAWWNEYEKDETRDQFSLPYVLWKKQIPKDKIKIIGTDAGQNPRFTITIRK